MTLKTNEGNKLEKGAGTNTGTWESVKLTFDEKTMPVGFYGDAGPKFFQTLGGIVVPEDCYKGKVASKKEEKDLTDSDN